MANLGNICRRVEEAANAIATLPAEQRSPYVLYLLEALQDKTMPYHYRTMLEQVKQDIITYLRAGRW